MVQFVNDATHTRLYHYFKIQINLAIFLTVILIYWYQCHRSYFQMKENYLVIVWLLASNNFWYRQKLKMWISGALFEQKFLLWQSETYRYLNNRWIWHVFFWTIGRPFHKNSFKEVIPQIKISESTKSALEKLNFLRFMQKKLQIYIKVDEIRFTPTARWDH